MRRDHAAIRHGCWCNCCAISGLPLGSLRATSSSSRRMCAPSTGLPDRPPTLRICMPGARCICPVPAGSASIPPRVYSPARGTSRSPARPNRQSAAPVTRSGRRVRSQVRAYAACGARLGGAPGHEALHRSAVDTDRAPGRAIDEDLVELDVRLTMGGEPTFVSVDDPDGAEWNTAALGENKRDLAVDLYQRLRERYAPNGPCAFRPRQMVSGRAAAALVAQLLLASRRRSDLVQSGANCR